MTIRPRITAAMVVLFVVCLALAVTPSRAQVTGGTMTGTVSDPGGAVVPDASVVATNLGTNAEYRTRTTSAGAYTLLNLPAGRYSLSIEVSGFQKYVRSPLDITQGTTVGVDAVLQVGQITEIVEVTGAAPQLQTESSEVGHQVSQKFVQELPLVQGGDVRDPEAFIFLLPGATGDSWLGHINGGQAFTKEITVDGVSNNLSTVQGSFFENSPPYEALAEFKLDTSNYSAEYGSAQAGMTQYQLKSGTNLFHGSVYSSIQNEILNANDILSNMGQSGEPPDSAGNAFKPPRKGFNAAVSAGGPMYIPGVYDGRNKTFIFSAFEGATFRRGIFGAQNTFPVQDLLGGDFSGLLGASVGTDCLGRDVLAGQIYDPTTTQLCPDGVTFVRDPFLDNQVPIRSTIAQNLLPHFPSIAGPQTSNNFPGDSGDQVKKDIAYWLLKVDQNLSDRHKLSASFNLTRRPRLDTNGGGLPGDNPLTNWDNQKVTTKNARLSYDSNLLPNLLNHFTAGYSRFRNPHRGVHVGTDLATQFGFQGLPRFDQGLPEIQFRNGSFPYRDLGLAGPDSV
ncbi:MAG: carboxypeptidase regulatory-like domain-containing protein, partial [Acidobacteria bacterium]|nr:carboxypeptidase regulatory-like domain-containing protein [Acidobacteriota bacterium]